MAANKTVPTDADMDAFLNAVPHPTRRADATRLRDMLSEITGEPPRMWGESIVGFGAYRYRTANGREEKFFLTGFAPRKQNTVVYVMPGFEGLEERLAKLGKHKTGRSCLYITRLEQIDEAVLREIIQDAVTYMRQRYPE